MNCFVRFPALRSGLTVVVSCALVLCLGACGTGSGGSQNPSTPYKGATPWNIANGGPAPHVAQADTTGRK